MENNWNVFIKYSYIRIHPVTQLFAIISYVFIPLYHSCSREHSISTVHKNFRVIYVSIYIYRTSCVGNCAFEKCRFSSHMVRLQWCHCLNQGNETFSVKFQIKSIPKDFGKPFSIIVGKLIVYVHPHCARGACRTMARIECVSRKKCT